MKRIGFFGGCFNPPTVAHIEIAKKELKDFNLDKIIFVPMGDKYSKIELIKFDHRYKMLELCCKDINNIEISDMQKYQIEKKYAIETFKEIEKKYDDTENFFIMGIDNFIKMQDWKLYDELMKYQYIVFKRRNIAEINGKFDNVHFVEFDFDISSSYIRELIKNDKQLNGLLQKDVEFYIKKHGLYK